MAIDKCYKPEDHTWRFDEETPLDKGVYLILTCEKCGLIAEGVVNYVVRS